MPVYPELVPVPGYPVYYAPQVNSNYFFYDGMYWVYQQDNWYASSWYNGPWALVAPEVVPLFVLRVPVRYYRQPPAYFHGWAANAPPRWGEHWGNTWAAEAGGWDNWNRNSVPAPAPLPIYQRQYSGNQYPRAEQQQALQSQNYRYQPHEAVVQQHYQTQRVQTAPAVAPNSAVVPNVRVEAPATKAQQQHVEGQQKAQQQREAATKQQTQQQQQAATQQKAQQQQQAATQQKAQQQRVASQQNAQHQQQEQQQATPQQKAQQQPREKQTPEKAEQQGGEKGK